MQVSIMMLSLTSNIAHKVLKFLQNLLALLVSAVSAMLIFSDYKVLCCLGNTFSGGLLLA